MSRAVRDEYVDDLAMRVVIASIPARRPADRLDLMIVAASDHVTPRFSESFDYGSVSRGGRPVHRGGVVARLPCIDVHACRDQLSHSREIPRSRGDKELIVNV